jgi:pimeloyl-ACP methyl ester carboxylesterase
VTDPRPTPDARYVRANGLDLWVGFHGQGRPLVLLHGGLGSGEMFGPVLPLLAERHAVVTVDLQGHGRTADVDRPLDIRTMADDVAGVIEALGLDRPDVAGFSLGGGVALQTAVRHPGAVRRCVSASAAIRRDAAYPDILGQQRQISAATAEMMVGTPMYEHYQQVAPRPEDFPRLLDKIGDALRRDFDFTDDVRGLQVPTCIVAADADMAPPSHFVEAFALLDGGQRDGGWGGEGRPKGGHALAILPGLTHYDLVDSPLFAAVTLDFLAD